MFLRRARFFFFALMLLAGFSAAAEGPFAFASTPGQLPKTVVPRHYAVRIESDMESFITRGTVQVEIEVLRPVREIVLNAVELKVTGASLQQGDKKPTALKARLDAAKQQLILKSRRTLKPGDYVLSLEFTGKIREQAEGFFYAKYPTSSGMKVMLATQMEPTDARRMFPCWDEPVFRATFDLTVALPEKFKAFSNMPVTRETPLPHGRKEIAFARTPPMSSYLVVLVAGELESLQDEAEGVKLRVITTQGKVVQGHYALDAAKKLLAYYNDYFGIKYPLPKLDLIAIPGGFDGAMENWGGIAFNESVLLYDPATSSPQTQREIFVTVAHEMAHQWFGNLVTMAWWDNLWLNEGFATWMETKATDHFKPDWNMWLSADSDKSSVMSSDAHRPTHPIQQSVANESEANDAFDSITYQKGGAFLRMLEDYLGPVEFRHGIQHYLSAHEYSNTTTADLWTALEEVSGKPIHSLAAGWTEQAGVPVVKVEAGCVDGREIVSLRQERLVADRPRAKPMQWQIPVSILLAPGTNIFRTLLNGKSNAVTLADCAILPKANAGDAGYYRTWYAPELFAKLHQSIHQLPVADRFNLLDDCWAMVEANRMGIGDYFGLADSLRKESAKAIWEQMLGTLGYLDDLEQGEPEHDAFQKYARSLLQPKFQQLGWEQKPGERMEDTLVRGKIIEGLGRFRDEAVIAEAKVKFEKFLAAPESLPPSLRRATLKTVGRYADQQTYDQLHRLALRANGTEERQLYYSALCAAQDAGLARETLALALKDEASPEEATGWVIDVAANGHVALAWDFARTHARELLAKVGTFSRDSYLPSICASFSDAARAEELEKFVGKNFSPDALDKARETAVDIRFKAAFKQRELPVIDRWTTNYIATNKSNEN